MHFATPSFSTCCSPTRRNGATSSSSGADSRRAAWLRTRPARRPSANWLPAASCSDRQEPRSSGARALDWIHAGRDDGTYQRRLRQVGTVALLVLDDFGLTPLPEHQQQDLYEVICNRYERHATAITSNRDFNEWPLVFANPLMVSATHGPAGASRREDRHRGQELSHGQLRAPLTGTAAALGGPAMRPYRPGARGCPDTTSPSGGALRAVLARCLFGRRTEMHPESRRSGIPAPGRQSSACLRTGASCCSTASHNSSQWPRPVEVCPNAVPSARTEHT